jgi:flagellar hook-associated protein 1 FlgK
LGGLSGTLGIAINALIADQGSLQVTANNIANANTPGYTREQANLAEQPPVQIGNLLFGEGVVLQNIQSIRDAVLELRIQQENQIQQGLSSFIDGAKQVQALFNETQGVGLENVISQFFSSFQALSTNPTSIPLRQGVLSAAQSLVDAFHQTSASLQQIQKGLDQTVTQDVGQVNLLASEVARLNGQISAAQVSGQSAGALIDQRTQLVNQLANLVGLNITNNESGTYTISTENGTPLVVGVQSYALQAQLDPASGTQHVYFNGNDITSTITRGALGGTLQVRDQMVPSIQSSLDTLAANIVNSVNAQHAAGYDLSGNPGGSFFTPLTGTAGAATQISLAVTDPSQIAAGSDGTLGSNGNALALAAIENQPIVSGQTATDFYAGMVNNIGSQVSFADSRQQAESALILQLKNQLNSVSGVSIDQEAANLVMFQQAYEASAKVVSVISQLMQTTINMA